MSLLVVGSVALDSVHTPHDSREDIFHLIDALDNIPNKAESILRRIYTQNIEIKHGMFCHRMVSHLKNNS